VLATGSGSANRRPGTVSEPEIEPEIEPDLSVEEQMRLLVCRVRNRNDTLTDRARFLRAPRESLTKRVELQVADEGTTRPGALDRREHGSYANESATC
jgi:hypothetical protein